MKCRVCGVTDAQQFYKSATGLCKEHAKEYNRERAAGMSDEAKKAKALRRSKQAKDSATSCARCGVKLSSNKPTHCRKCSGVVRSETHPRKERVRRTSGSCTDCGIPIAGRKAIRCPQCAGKARQIHIDKVLYKRNHELHKKYGMPPGEFDGWWIVFMGKCGICGREMKMPERRRGQSLETVTVDHCHKTGQIRGLLCSACNKGIGLFYDNPDFLRKAASWVTK